MKRALNLTPEALADIRHRYLETDEPVEAIRADYGLLKSTFYKLRKSENWPARSHQKDVPPDRKLKLEAENAVKAHVEGEPQVSTLSIVERLEKAVEKELASLEMRRATLGNAPAEPADAERATRTIQRLTETLYKIRRLRLPEEIATGQVAGCDIPRDIDEFRRGLARKIEILRSQRDRDVS